jgi:hypothetical protein
MTVISHGYVTAAPEFLVVARGRNRPNGGENVATMANATQPPPNAYVHIVKSLLGGMEHVILLPVNVDAQMVRSKVCPFSQAKKPITKYRFFIKNTRIQW